MLILTVPLILYIYYLNCHSLIQFSCSVMSDSLQPHGLQHARSPCPSPTPWVYSNSCPLSQWCHPTISSSVIPFSSCLQSFPASDLFQWVSSLHQVAKVLEFQLQHQSFQWIFRTNFLRMDWLDLLAVQGTLKSLLQHSSKASVFRLSAFFMVQHSHPYMMTTGKTIAFTRWTFIGKIMSLLINTLSTLVIVIFPRSNCLLISWPQSPSAVILEPKKIKSVTVSIVCPSICHEEMGPDAMILVFWMLSFKPAFSLSFTFNKRLFSSSSLSPIRGISACLRLWTFRPAILTPACASSNLAFHMMNSAYKLNKQGDNI